MLMKLRIDTRLVYSLYLLPLVAATSHAIASRTLAPTASAPSRTARLGTPAPTTISPRWNRRQQNDGALSLITADINTTVPTVTSSNEVITTTSLTPATGTLEIWATMGLIMPNPYDKIYTNVSYNFGFVNTLFHYPTETSNADSQVDPVRRPAPTAGGWLRQVQPLLIFPNYTVNVFSSSGTLNTSSPASIPDGSPGLCGATAENYAVHYPFIFRQPGWYMFVINQTWAQASLSEDNTTCLEPYKREDQIFSWMTLSVAPYPTNGAQPVSPSQDYTVFRQVSFSTAPDLPYDPAPTTHAQALGIGLGVTVAVLAFTTMAFVFWWIRQRRFVHRELLAFERMNAREKQDFLRASPGHWLDPYAPERYDPRGNWHPPAVTDYLRWRWQQRRGLDDRYLNRPNLPPKDRRPTQWVLPDARGFGSVNAWQRRQPQMSQMPNGALVWPSWSAQGRPVYQAVGT